MSTWTDEKHEAARARCEAATAGPWEVLPDLDAVIVLDGYGDPLWEAVEDRVGTMWEEDGAFIAHARTDIPALLDEIERLRAESARRMVWLETEQRAHEQTHAALVDMTERAAKPEVTDDMVERLAIHQNDTHLTTWRFPWKRLSEEDKKPARAEARWALEAALNPKEEA